MRPSLNWVVFEPPVREPLLTVLVMLGTIGGLVAMPTFFLVGGLFTPPSLRRKGLSRFARDRAIRLGVPLVFFVVFLAPFVEYVDADNLGWTGGFLAFAATMWWPWPPAWGPTWFLAVLLLFSLGYGLMRTALRAPSTVGPPRARMLVAAAAVTGFASFAIRIRVPLAEEMFRLALGQSPAWLLGFGLGVLATEQRWLETMDRRFVRRLGFAAGIAIGTILVSVGVAIAAGADFGLFAGGGSWYSLVAALSEGVLLVTGPLWLVATLRSGWNRQGALGRWLSRPAFAAFLVHQPVLVGYVLLTRLVGWAPEVEWLGATVAAVATSFGLAALLLRIPGVSRIVG